MNLKTEENSFANELPIEHEQQQPVTTTMTHKNKESGSSNLPHTLTAS